MDETTLRLLCVLVKCWMRRGQQKRVGTPGQQKWHHLFGAYNWRTDEVITTTSAKKNTVNFCLFIEHLMSVTPDDKPIVLVMDNASYHHSIISKALLAYFEDRAMVVWLPPYCSEINPIERYWRHMKEAACANKLFKSIGEIVDSVGKVLSIQNDLTSSERFLYSKT